MEIKTFIDAKINREKVYKLQKIFDGKYTIFIEDNDKQEYDVFNTERFKCFIQKELSILDDEFKKI